MSILENRRKWIDHLKDPSTKKFGKLLESISDPEARCCLGHACHVLGAVRCVMAGSVFYDGSRTVLSQYMVDQLGLHTNGGRSNDGSKLGKWNYSTLSVINDHTDANPQEIGAYLETVIMGGPHTPFKEIKDA